MAQDDDLLAEIRRRFSYVQDQDKENRDRQRDDTAFVYVDGAQWDDTIRKTRTGWNEPCLEFNQLKQFVHQVVNDMRQQRPGIKVHPASGDASVDTAKILQGMVREIEYSSNADAAYASAYQNAVVGGRGYLRAVTEYAGPDTFDQVIRIKRVADPMLVYMDPDFQEPDGSDANFCFVIEDIEKDDFRKLYPGKEPVSWSEADDPSWFPEEGKIRIADYYRRIKRKRTLVALHDGRMGYKDEFPELAEEQTETGPEETEPVVPPMAQADAGMAGIQPPGGTPIPGMGEPPGPPATPPGADSAAPVPPGMPMPDLPGGAPPTPQPPVAQKPIILAEREVDSYKIEWFKVAGGAQILEEYECPGEYIPVITVMGDDVIYNGKRIFEGLIRKARDPQRMFNFGMTAQAIHLALTPRAPWVIAEGQIEGFENIWKDANTRNYQFLPYKPTSLEGLMVPPPQRTSPSMPDAGWINWCNSMTQMIRSTIGMYESSLGMKGQEISGKAIMAREKQGDNATYHYVDNLARAMCLLGRIIVSWIPHYYDTARIVHMVGDDDQRTLVKINDPMGGDPLAAIRKNDVTTGKYSVTIDTGPSYKTKRQESAETLTQLVQAFPPMMQIAGDLVVRAQDIPDAQAISDRLRATLPPPIQQLLQQQEKNGGKAPDPAAMAQIQQMSQQLQQMQQGLQEMQQENQQLKTGVQAKIEEAHISASIEKYKAELNAVVQIQIERMKAGIQQQIDEQTFDKELLADVQKMMLEQQGDQQSQAAQQEHEMAMAQQDQAHQQGMQANDQAAQAQQQAMQAAQQPPMPGPQ